METWEKYCKYQKESSIENYVLYKHTFITPSVITLMQKYKNHA